MKKVTIIDYYLGNLYSVRRALEHLGCQALITEDPEAVSKADYLILPGVGAFGEGMMRLKKLGLDQAIVRFVERERPFLGICLGMQLLMSESQELGRHRGLDLIPGDVLPLRSTVNDGTHYKVPHVGWNTLCFDRQSIAGGSLLRGIAEKEYFYFVHSFGVYPEEKKAQICSTRYGENEFCSVVRKNSIFGCQFHPEKSGDIGLVLLKNFINL